MNISECTILLAEDDPDAVFLNEGHELQNHVNTPCGSEQSAAA